MAHCHPTDLSSWTHNLYDLAKKSYTTNQVYKLATLLLYMYTSKICEEYFGGYCLFHTYVRNLKIARNRFAAEDMKENIRAMLVDIAANFRISNRNE